MAQETITIDATTDLVIHTTERSHWIWCTNSYVLYNKKVKGEDRDLPGQHGTSGNPRYLDAIVHTLQLVITGTSLANLRTNIAAVQAATDPIDTGDGTRLVTWFDGTNTLTADCHVSPVMIGRNVGDKAVLATIELQVDAGEFV